MTEKIKLTTFFEHIEFSQYKPLAEKGRIPLREREIETIFALCNGYIGTRNSLEESYPESDPGSFIAGLYVKGPEDDFNFLVRTPDWTSIKIYAEDELFDLKKNTPLHHLRYIDFENGTVVREWKNIDEEGRITNIKIIKYISLAHKHEMGKLLVLKPENYSEKLKVVTGINCNTADFTYLLNMNSEVNDLASIFMKTKHSDRSFAMVQKSFFSSYCRGQEKQTEYNYEIENFYNGSFESFSWQAELGNIYVIKSLCSTTTCFESENPIKYALSVFKTDEDITFDRSMRNHSQKWDERFKGSRIIVTGNEYDQKLIDFALYHLITAGEFSGNNYSIPARDLSGESYKGHVFWDTEMYLLPFYIYTSPEIARSLLMYRYNTLEGARENSIQEDLGGASFAWESTDSGLEAAPEITVLPNGEIVQILSGRYENHISPDIAYTIWKYWQATCDDDFIVNYGAEIIFETARYCKSLLDVGEDNLYHIKNVIGPDEYHECIDDNAYTNYLAKNNFDIAIKTYRFLALNHPEKLEILQKKINFSENEVEDWEDYKNRIYMGYNQETKLYEQFKGFYELKYIDLKEYEPRSVPMDVILGRECTRKTQVIKQADVLMFLMLFGERFSQEEIIANYEFYEKRCGHGSSLSPSVHSIVAARAQKPEDAYSYFLKNARIDIGDAFGNASGGIHIASLGGVWMSVALGFAGMHTTEKGLIFNPCFPSAWENIKFMVKWRNQDVKVFLSSDEITFFVSGENNIEISAGFNNWKNICPDEEINAIRKNGKWEWRD